MNATSLEIPKLLYFKCLVINSTNTWGMETYIKGTALGSLSAESGNK